MEFDSGNTDNNFINFKIKLMFLKSRLRYWFKEVVAKIKVEKDNVIRTLQDIDFFI